MITVHLERNEVDGGWLVEASRDGCLGLALRDSRALAACDADTVLWDGTEWTLPLTSPSPPARADFRLDFDGAPLASVWEPVPGWEAFLRHLNVYRWNGTWEFQWAIDDASPSSCRSSELGSATGPPGLVLVRTADDCGVVSSPMPPVVVLYSRSGGGSYLGSVRALANSRPAFISFDEAGRPIVAIPCFEFGESGRRDFIWIGRWDGKDWIRFEDLPFLALAGVGYDGRRVVVAAFGGPEPDGRSPLLHVFRSDEGRWTELAPPGEDLGVWHEARLAIGPDREPIVAFMTPGPVIEVRRYRPVAP